MEVERKIIYLSTLTKELGENVERGNVVPLEYEKGEEPYILEATIL
jgi:hypothetical protein